jgi:crotonobetainyl-CoA:carnitine CoA-transferase CaiB-like acyl-CoA transferase
VPRGIAFAGRATLESSYPVSDMAAASIATAALATAQLATTLGLDLGDPTVDRSLADAWFGPALRPVGWQLPSPWDPIAGDYSTADGWIRLHTNAPHHRAAALRALGLVAREHPSREEVADAVAGWQAGELETVVVEAGGCAAALRSPAAWARHPQGAALAAEPLVHLERTGADDVTTRWAPTAAAPLAGVRVLDLTRVLAGPVATRFLAGLGADVLRIDPPGWDEPALVPEMTLGKRSARLDARDRVGLARLTELLAGADVLVSGYRTDALERLGLGDEARRRIRPGLVDVSLNAYGHTGPWAARRGFDSLVQMSTGIAAAGLRAGTAPTPTPLPVQALDQATGYLVAAAVLAGLARRLHDGRGSRARLSLARTAVELVAARGLDADTPAPGAVPPRSPLATPWGPAELLDPPLSFTGGGLRWGIPPRPLGSDAPTW